MSEYQLNPGRYEGIPAAIYHAWEADSRSDLNLILRSPAHYVAAKKSPIVPTPAMNLGTAVHVEALEKPGELETQFYEDKPPASINRRTNEGKEQYAAWLAQHAGKTPLPSADWNKIPLIVEALMAEPTSRTLLGAGPTEVSYVWSESHLGDLLCRCRPDVEIPASNLLVDLKTGVDARPEVFSKSIANLGYHRQAAWYLRGANAVMGAGTYTRFAFVVVEKTPPFGIGCYVMDERDIERGEREMVSAMQRLKFCRDNDTWPGYGRAITPIGLPVWARRQLDEGRPS